MLTKTRTSRIFISAWLLSEITLVSVVLKFVERLNQLGYLGLGDGFSGNQIFWGDGILANCFHIVVIMTFAWVFGFLYGYLIKRKVGVIEKTLVSVANTVFAIFGEVIITVLIVGIAGRISSWDLGTIPGILDTIFSQPFYATFFIINVVGCYLASYFSIEKGREAIEDTPYQIDHEENSGTLMGIKWYHYLWLWIPIGLYGELFTSILYGFFKVILNFFHSIHWLEFLGVTTSGNSTIGTTYWSWVILACAAYWIVLALEYLRQVLAGEKVLSKTKSFLTAAGIGVVLPLGILILFALV